MNWIDRKMASLGEVTEQNLKELAVFIRRHQAGVYMTIIFHLVLLVLFLSVKLITINSQGKDPIVLDFEQEKVEQPYEKEFIQKELAQIKQELEASVQSNLHNASADISAESKKDNKPMSDDRNTEANKLYAEAKQLQARLEAGKSNLSKLEQSEDGDQPTKGVESSTKTSKVANPGKVLVNYDLGGRKSYRLPVPAYTCQGGGEVRVSIEVDKQGYVVNAKVDGKNSSADECLWTSALRSAKMSRFQIVEKPAGNQSVGYILYRFIPQ